MITQFVAFTVIAIGMTFTADNSPVTKPTCCAKNAYCCSIKARCCGTASTLGFMVELSDDVASSQSCCVKRAYCCTLKRPCCGNSGKLQAKMVPSKAEHSKHGDQFAKLTCCKKRAYCCTIKRPCCGQSVTNSVA